MEVAGATQVSVVAEEATVEVAMEISSSKRNRKRKTSSTLPNTWTRKSVSNSTVAAKVRNGFSSSCELSGWLIGDSYRNTEGL